MKKIRKIRILDLWPKLVLIYRPRKDGRLSWPGWLVTHRDGCPAPGNGWSGIQVGLLTSPDLIVNFVDRHQRAAATPGKFRRALKTHTVFIYAKMRVSGQGCAFWGLDNIRLHLVGQPPKKTSPKLAGIGISQPNRRSSNIAISITNEDIRVIFRSQMQYRRHYQRSAKLHQMES